MTSAAAANTRKRKNLTPAERAEVVAFFLRVSKELQPPIGAIPECAAKYECSVDQIDRLLRRAVQDIKAGHPINYDSGRKDYNANDFGFFASIQSLPYKKMAQTIEDLVNNVEEAFNQLQYSTIGRVFVTLQSVLQASMNVDDSNKYTIPHLVKDQLRMSNGLLPPVLSCSNL
ncbi:hypothetical protein F441_18530 [Phytophthora nicotianae CJ01A1]|uniref:Uncharacterized protein n=1 Tax=Phytophthora nicotianae CJ01A1 TaxID=1317063 RepID=W2W2G6_PHYNI|nr:hypothetical protein F441_18530 [Phytophthora nicotianae CJ01A1]